MRRMLTAACAALSLLAGASRAIAGDLVQVADFGPNPGALQMWSYAPDHLPAHRPLLVYLHGCGSSPDAVDSEIGWRRWADERGFAIVFPQQVQANNGLRCFNWFQPGDRARAASDWSGPWPRVSIWHGSYDLTVSPATMGWLVAQWTNLHGADQTPDDQGLEHGYPHKVYRDDAGAPVVETYSITGKGHGEFVDPGPGPQQCGVAGGFIIDADICASYFIAQWFGL